MTLTSKDWWRAALIRAVKTFFQTAISFTAVGASLSEVHWFQIGSVSMVAAIFSLCTSLAGLPEVETPIKTDISPDMEETDVIDTSEEDAKLEGNLLSDTLERGEG